MRLDDLTELHYITPIQNVPSILQRGILSHKLAEKHHPETVAMPEIQDRRATVRVPDGSRFGRPLHEYTNLYFHARNPMLFKRQGLHQSLCVLRISTDVLHLPAVVVCGQNAASGYARFDNVADGLARIDRDVVFAEDWRHPGDPPAYYHHKSVKCAEVLVPDRVPPSHVQGAYVSCASSKQMLIGLAPSLHVVVDAHLFFQ